MSKIIILLLGFSLQIHASSYSQVAKFTLKLENATVKKVFNEIEKSSEFRFVYKKSDITSLGKVNLDVKSIRVEDILDKCFKNSNVTYSVMDKHIVIKKVFKVKDEEKDGYMTGKVIDEKCHAMPGVTVLIQGTSIGVSTDARGRYKIKAKKGDALKFSFIGYRDQLILIEDQKKINVQMQSKSESLEEVSVVAFGEQKKESVVSAITTVKSDALKSSNSDLTTAFAGNIPGMIGWQTGGAPGALTEEEMNTKFYIRGITSYQTGANIDPLVLLDGVEVSKLDLARIDPDDIETFSVMKDAAATAMYGARGANGVIYVKTKKGKQGNVYTSFRYERIYSEPTEVIEVVGAKDYMKLYNEALMGRDPYAMPTYTREKIKNTGSSKYPSWVYPNNDWYNQIFKDKAVNNHYALNVRGGGAKMQYYASVTHNSNEGVIKTDALNQFDCNITNKQTNFRVNLNINLNATAKLTLNSFSTYDNYHGTAVKANEAYFMAFRASPVEFAPTYPADKDHNWPHTLYGAGNSVNPYMQIQKGYVDRVRFSSINNFEYIQSLSSFIKGLELRASVGLTKTGFFTNEYGIKPSSYELATYSFVTGEHTLTPHQMGSNKILKIGTGSRASKTTMNYMVKLLHGAKWGNHQTSFTGVFTARQTDLSTPKSLTESLPYRNISFASRVTYGYKDKYYFEGSVGVNGSERFAKNNRIGYFPAGGCAWILSKENFMRALDRVINFAKIRLSYGLTGNDGVINDPRFMYLQEVIDGKGEAPYIGAAARPLHYFYVKSYGNKSTKWETAEQFNLGLELKLFGGLFEFNTDIYQEIRHNIYDYRRVLPASLGLWAKPLDNVGKVKSRGIDFNGKLQHAFNSDCWVILNGTFTYNKATFKKIEEATGKKVWQQKVGHDISQPYCYIADGLFQNKEEIDNAAFQNESVQPGDIRYKDVDGNGQIDINDAVMIGFPEVPRIVYGINGFVHYKNIEFSMAFQGSGQRSFFIDPMQVSPFYGNRAVLKEIAKDHWTEDNHAARPFWPKLGTDNISEYNPQEDYKNIENSEIRKSTYFMKEGKFIRCKSIELGCYLNKKWLEKFKVKKCRLYFRANNPFIISDFKVWDVELGGNGFNYPIQKTYSAGFNISF